MEQLETRQKIIAIDFDGTIVSNNYPKIGDLKENVKETIDKFKRDGYYIIIWTCRANKKLEEAINFLLENNIYFDRINDDAPFIINEFGNSNRKVFADLYIDDRFIYNLPNWNYIYYFARNRLQ